MKLIKSWFWVFLCTSVSAFGVEDFKVEYLQPRVGANESLVRVTPPARHHLNLNAPFSVESVPSVLFSPLRAEIHELVFISKTAVPKDGEEIVVSAFLCDDANTYCLKKKIQFKVSTANRLIDPVRYNSFMKPDVKSPAKGLPKKSKNELHGFIDNDSARAIELAKKEQKLLLIDFYGIWCPPCNLLEETVFNSDEFKDAAVSLVLLRMDADRESSWTLKSKFRVGGYPTLIITTPDFVEIDRIVGYLTRSELVSRLKQAQAVQWVALEKRVLALKGQPEYLENLKRLIEVEIERKDFDQALLNVQDGLKVDSKNLFFRLIEIQELARKFNDANNKGGYRDLFQKAATRGLFKEVQEKLHDIDSSTLLIAEDLVVSASENADMNIEMKWVEGWIESLRSRVNAKTLFIDHSEYSIADIDSLNVEWVEKITEKTKDKEPLQAAYESAILSYKKMIGFYKNQDSRALHLELGYYLRKAGKISEAKNLYSRFTRKYPAEFTFFFAESKLYSELKEFPHAIASAQKAVRFAYGDNLIRSVESLAEIQFKDGDAKGALKTIDEYLPKFKTPEGGLFVRTQRYIDQVKRLREKIVATPSKA